jgi:hypothetical protein
MAITLTAAFLAELKAADNVPDTVLSIALDSGTVKYGLAAGNGFSDIKPCIGSVSSLQNRLDPKKAYSTRGQITFQILGRDNFKNIIRDEYLKNRRVTRYDGFIASGFAWSDYAATFTGIITDWARKGDVLSVTVADDLAEGVKKIPAENATKTQYLDYTGSGAGMNPVDIMQSILKNDLGISASLVDDTQFDSEQGLWLAGWLFSRVLTEPKDANKYLNELQEETNSFIIHDGEKITYKVFAPPVPGSTVEAWTDNNNILDGTLSCKSGYKDFFFNRVVVYYDYDESGSNNEENFEAAVIAVDAASQDSAQWSEVKTKVIKSKWVRSITHIQPTNVTGVVIYHVSVNNGAGSGTLTFTYDADGEHTLEWSAPGGTIGEAVTVSKDGKFQVFDADKTKWVRVVVTNGSLAGSNKSDTITLTALSASIFASTLAQKILSRYRDPSSVVTFEVDINNVAYNSVFIKPTDLKDLTTDEAFEKGDSTWVAERVMLTSVRPDIAKGRVQIEAIETKMYHLYGFIAPASQPDWNSATAVQKEYAYLGDAANNELGSANDPGFYIW